MASAAPIIQRTPQAPIPVFPPQQSVKIYNAVYSSVQVYECMVRGIAVMRRRVDSFVNATQILKVAGIDKGRRTKILEKEILPGKHEIVQGGYGKYQGTWIPLERGRDVAAQYGVAPLLAPLFEFIPAQAMNILSPGMPAFHSLQPGRPGAGQFFTLSPGPPVTPSHVGAPAMVPGSALKLLNQGRAQGLFTPSMSTTMPPNNSNPPTPQPYPVLAAPISATTSPRSVPTPSPVPISSSLKRTRTESDAPQESNGATRQQDIQMADGSNPASTSTLPTSTSTPTAPPAKRPRTTEPEQEPALLPPSDLSPTLSATLLAQKQSWKKTNGRTIDKSSFAESNIRFSNAPTVSRNFDRKALLRSTKANALLAAISKHDSERVLQVLTSPETHTGEIAREPNYDFVVDDQGHTSLHLAAAFADVPMVESLIARGADVNRGSFAGETALIRTVLSLDGYNAQNFNTILAHLHASIRTLDRSRRTVLHHIALVAGVKGRASASRYYMTCVVMWIAQRENGDFKSVIDLQDEHGDTALNIAARVGNRELVRTLIDFGANRILPNKLGLRPGDFGVEGDSLTAPGTVDYISSLRDGVSLPIQKSQDVINDITSMVESLRDEYSVEIKKKTDSLEGIQGKLKAATRQLAEQRRQIASWQAKCSELDQVQQKIRNLERGMEAEDSFDWTGRTELDGTPSTVESAGPAFVNRGPTSTLAMLDSVVLDVAPNLDADPTITVGNTRQSLVRLRRLLTWHRRADALLQGRIEALHGASAEKELMCKRILSASTGVPVDDIEKMTGQLVIAVDSEPQMVDLGRVASFMHKVREGNTQPTPLPWALSR
ncbi:apses-domain-containing protein [Sistotremastrum niveocremeum HHB9708]|uniref:Apses-domain-containing protein n=1 Tax=Sistotremastrum niveocremeum HHB9708 TaxID=1314777 RepID=A0A164VPG0_9AGAM|nr:apses-domain-containing protein [Sistotremastrum niveocremeum HHB9708]